MQTDEAAEKLLEQLVEQDKKEMSSAFSKGMFIIVLSFLTIFIPSIANRFFNTDIGWFIIIYPFLVLAMIFIVLYKIWAPVDVHSFFLEEGKCLSLEVGGEVTAIIMRKKGYCFGPGWEVIEETDQWKKDPDYKKWNPTRFHLQGMYILFNPFEYVKHIPRIWLKSVNKKPVQRVKVIKRLSLNPYLFYEEVDDAEDSKKAPIDYKFATEGTITNPYIVIYKINDWVNFKSDYVTSATTNYFKTKTIDQIIGLKSYSSQIFDYMKSSDSENVLDRIKNVLGLRVSQILTIEFNGGDEETKEAMKRKAIALFNLDAEKINASIEAYKTFGPFWENLSIVTGKSIEDLQKEYAADAPAFEKKYEIMLSRAFLLTREKMETKSGAFSRHVFEGLGGDSNKDSNGDATKAILALVLTKLGEQSKGSSKKDGKSKDGEEGLWSPEL